MRVPPALQSLVGGYDWLAARNGRPSADVFELQAESRPRLFLKTEKRGAFEELAGETERLHWLFSTGILCPQVLGYVAEGNQSWMVITALAGVDLGAAAALPPSTVVEMAAAALSELHGLDATSCPFDHRVGKRMEMARARLLAGVVDENDFDESRQGRPAAELFEMLRRQMPDEEDLVVTHGDACFPNLMADGERFTGFLDAGRLGIADRHQDLALMAREIGADFGPEWVEEFFRAYGRPAIPEKLAFFQLLDEFF